MTISARLEAAYVKRVRWASEPNVTAYRIFHGRADGLDGLAIDRFGDVLIVQLLEGRLTIDPDSLRSAMMPLLDQWGIRAAYLKQFLKVRDQATARTDALHHEPRPWIGEPAEEEFAVIENGLTLRVRPYDGFSVGLFLEHRDNRRRVRELASGRRVLNAFSYTCGFSVAAAAGGASTVASVDLSKKYLEWGKRNFAANGLPLDPHRFFASDTFDFYARAKRQGRRFDLIVLDPPSFSKMRRPHRSFSLEEQLEPLCAGAVEILDPGGYVLLCTNHRGITLDRLADALNTAARNRRVQIVDRPTLPLDFADDPDYSKSILARFD